MKKLYLLLSALFLIFLSSCDKKYSKENSESFTFESSSPILSSFSKSDFIYFDKDLKQISIDGLRKDPEILIIADATSGKKVHCIYFSNEDEAYNFTVKTGKYPDLKENIENVRKVKEFARRYNVNFDSDETPPQEVVDYLSTFELEIQPEGVGLLYDYYDCLSLSSSGGTIPITGNPQPSLFSFNNRASVAQGIGLANRIWDRK